MTTLNLHEISTFKTNLPTLISNQVPLKKLKLLISPRSKSAYFNDYLEVCKAELAWLLGSDEIQHSKIGAMDFLDFEASDEIMQKLSSLSFFYGVFEEQGSALNPLDMRFESILHEDFVFGAKFKGKTNESLTQLLINVGLQSIHYNKISDVKLLDPMCGRATTMLWAMQYGMKSKGIELDTKALADVRQNLKKWCKIHRQKHQLNEGFVNSKEQSQNRGKFIDFAVSSNSFRLINGDSRQAGNLLNGEKFNLLISDLPYGVQHYTAEKTRNSIGLLESCAQEWSDCLKPGGVMVLAFNRYQPKRKEMVDVFTGIGLRDLEFTAPHRMSESIVRDVVVFRKVSEIWGK